MSKDLRIQVIAELNKSLSKKELQNQLKSIEKDLKINIRFGLGNINAIQKRIQKLQHLIRSLNHESNNLELFSGVIRNNNNSQVTEGEAQQNKTGIKDMFSTAVTNFSIPQAINNTFLGLVNGFKDMVSQLIEIDSQMTALQRVSNGEFERNHILNESIILSERLGNKISEINEGLIENSRLGFRGDALIDITEAATLMSNVSDLKISESASTLTTALKGFNMEASEAVRIVDTLNETDNNYNYSIENMAQSIMQATGVANTFGVTLEELVAHTTAIGEVSGESGNTIGESLKTIYSRVTTLKESQDILNNVGVSIHDLNGDLKPVGKILDELANKWGTINSAMQQQIGVKLAGSSQLSPFLTMMQQWDQVENVLDTISQSTGSAYRENEENLKSLEARINMLSNAWTELVITLGDKFINNSLIGLIETLKSFTNLVSNITSFTGVLAPALGLVTAGFFMFNQSLKSNILSAKEYSESIKLIGLKNTIATTSVRGFTASLIPLKAGLHSVKIAAVGLVSFLSTAVFPIAIFVGIGFVIEQLFSATMKANEAQKEYNETLNKSTESLKNNSDNVYELFNSYKELESIKNSTGLNTEQEEEYVRIQNELAQLLPTIVVGEDGKGNAILANSKYIQKEIELLEERIKLEKELAIINAQESFDNIDKRRKKLEREIRNDEARKEQNQKLIDHGYFLTDTKELEKNIRNINKRLLENSIELNKLDAEQESTLKSLFDNIDQLNDSDFEFIKKLVNESSESFDQIQPVINDLIGLKILLDDTFSINKIEDLNKEQKGVLQSMSVALKNGYTDWEQWRQSLERVGFTSEETSSIIENMENKVSYIDKALGTGLYYDDGAKQLIQTSEELEERLNDVGYVFDENGRKMKSNAEGILELVDSSVELAKILEDATSSIKSLTDILFDLNEGQGITSDIITKLVKDYPELLEYIYDEVALKEKIIEKIEEQEKTYKDSLINQMMNSDDYIKMVSKSHTEFYNWLNDTYDIDLDNFKSLSKAKEDVENKLISKLSDRWGEYFRASYDGSSVLISDTESFFKLSPEDRKKVVSEVHEANRALKEAADRFDNISLAGTKIEFEGTANAIAGLTREQDKNTKSKDKNTNSNKINNDSIKESTYYVDEYKNALAQLNLELDKVNYNKSKYPSGSKEYRKALEDEIKFTKQLLDLNKKRQEDLQKQIDTKNFAPVGMVTKEISTSNSNINLASTGWGNKITSNFGKRDRPTEGASTDHKGIDIGFAQGSNLHSNISGTVKSASFTSGGYGGLIEITDDKGRVHKYAHLNQIDVKAGQQVNVGDIIAKTGGIKETKGAGTSTGAHLHYEVIVNGKAINPIEFINQAKGMQVSVDNIGKTQADLNDLIDKANNEIISEMQEEIKLLETLDNLELALINDRLLEFSNLREGADRSIQRSKQVMEEYSMSSPKFRDEIEKQNKQIDYQMVLYSKEADEIRKQLERDDLSTKVKNELTVKLSELILAYHELNAVVTENSKLYDDSLRLEQFVNKMEDLDYELQVSKGLMSLVNEESDEYTEHLIKQDKLLREKLKLNKEEIERLYELASTYVKGSKLHEDTIKRIRELTLESISYNNELQNLQETTKKLAQDKLNTITNVERKVIEMIKHRINEEKKVLQDNLKEYENYINEKIRILRKEHEEEDWEKSLQKEQEELIKLNAEYNKRMLDDSLASRNKQRELKKSIEEQEEKIREMLRKKGLDKQIENLEQLLKEEQEVTEDKLSELDKQLENDKLYMEARKAIESGYLKWYTIETKNVQGLVRSEFIETTRTLESAYIEFEDRFGEGMSILGEKIKSDFIENIKLAQQSIVDLSRLIKESSFDIGIGSDFTPVDLDVIGKDKVEGRPEQNLSSDDLNLLWAKFINDKVMTDSKVKSSQGSMRSFDKMKETVISWIGDRNSTIDPDNTLNFDRAFAMLESDQKQQVLEYIRKMMFSNNRVEDPVNISVIEDLLKHMVRLNTGGYLKGIGKQGGLAIVDDKELVLNQADTKNILETVKESRLLTSLKPSNLSNIIKQANPLQGIDLSFDKIIHVEGNLDSATMPKVQSAIKNAFSDLGRSFNMSGVFRRI